MIITIGYWISFGLLLYTTIEPKFNKYRPIAKGVTSLLFVSIYLILNDHFDLIMLIALLCCLCGDILLAFKKNGQKRFFVSGMLAFLLAHTFFLMVMTHYAPFTLIDTIMSIIALIILKVITYKLDIHFGYKRYMIWLYAFIVVLMGNKAIDMAIFAPSAYAILLGIGGTLFVISDIVLLFLYFKYKNNLMLQLTNSCIYYLAQFLLALAFSFYH